MHGSPLPRGCAQHWEELDTRWGDAEAEPMGMVWPRPPPAFPTTPPFHPHLWSEPHLFLCLGHVLRPPKTHCCECLTPALPQSGLSSRGTWTLPTPQHPSWPHSQPRTPQMSTSSPLPLTRRLHLGGSRGHILQAWLQADKVPSWDLPQGHCATIC